MKKRTCEIFIIILLYYNHLISTAVRIIFYRHEKNRECKKTLNDMIRLWNLLENYESKIDQLDSSKIINPEKIIHLKVVNRKLSLSLLSYRIKSDIDIKFCSIRRYVHWILLNILLCNFRYLKLRNVVLFDYVLVTISSTN